MARRRMIDPHIWDSGDVAKLDFFERLVLIGMFSHADDQGRGVGGAIFLRNTIFRHDDVSSGLMNRALDHIRRTISVEYYTVDGTEYYQFLNWTKWQRVDKPRPSLLPAPPEPEEAAPEVREESAAEGPEPMPGNGTSHRTAEEEKDMQRQCHTSLAPEAAFAGATAADEVNESKTQPETASQIESEMESAIESENGSEIESTIGSAIDSCPKRKGKGKEEEEKRKGREARAGAPAPRGERPPGPPCAASSGARLYLGRYRTVRLTQEELEQWKIEAPGDWEERIHKLDSYQKRSGRSYTGSLTTLRRWKKEDETREQRIRADPDPLRGFARPG